jgi:hypothetical protein
MANAYDPLAIRGERGPVSKAEAYRGRTICLPQIDRGVASLSIGELDEENRLGIARKLVQKGGIQPGEVALR